MRLRCSLIFVHGKRSYNSAILHAMFRGLSMIIPHRHRLRTTVIVTACVDGGDGCAITFLNHLIDVPRLERVDVEAVEIRGLAPEYPAAIDWILPVAPGGTSQPFPNLLHFSASGIITPGHLCIPTRLQSLEVHAETHAELDLLPELLKSSIHLQRLKLTIWDTPPGQILLLQEAEEAALPQCLR